MKPIIAAITLCALTWPIAAAQEQSNKVTVHGSIQSDILFPETDYKIGAEDYSEDVLTNTYASAALFSKHIDAGLRVEYLEHPLPGFVDQYGPDFKGWGLPNIFVKAKINGFEFTGGDFYEQFGNGFILRSYEERSLGIDNSIRGGRLKVNALKGFRFTALGGVQRHFWDWSTRSSLFGADVEWDANTFFKGLRDRNIVWTFGASYVLSHERGEDILVSGSNSKLKLPENVSAFDIRTHFYRSGLDLLAEFAWKGQQPIYDNNYTYRHGTAAMISASYSKRGWSAMLQAKRSDNMAFRNRRSEATAATLINYMPPFTYQHTYSLAAMYPYGTQMAPGEWAFQGAFAYSFKRGTTLGGKYGTKFKLNASYICGIERDEVNTANGNLAGSDWWQQDFGKFGDTYYTDIDLTMEKRVTRDFHLNLMYMFQKYNKTAVEGHGGMINSNIFVADGKYKFSKKLTLRAELQYLQTKDDLGDWVFGLAELSVAPYLMFSVSDQWNCGKTDIHYYMGVVTGNYKGNRLMVGYGRTREGINCTGGVCRRVPATRGFQISYSYNF